MMTNYNINNYNFIDFGCSKGNSISEAIKYYGGIRGLGIDIDPNKVEETINAGYDAVVQDATTFNEYHSKSVDFVTMIHFLEHLPGVGLAKKCIQSAIELSTQFVYIRQPFFDSDCYLFDKKLKFYWSDWSGHTNQMTALQFHNILRPLEILGKINSFRIYGLRKIKNSMDGTIHSIDSPVDQHHYDAQKHPPKNSVDFTVDIFKEILVVININEGHEYNSLLKNYEDSSSLLFDSNKIAEK